MGLAVQDGSDQPADVGGVELAVAVDIDDDVGPHLEGAAHTLAKGLAQPAVTPETGYLGAGLARPLNGGVGGAVVDHQHLDAADARNVARHPGHHLGDRPLLVETGNHHHQTGGAPRVRRDLGDPLRIGEGVGGDRLLGRRHCARSLASADAL